MKTLLLLLCLAFPALAGDLLRGPGEVLNGDTPVGAYSTPGGTGAVLVISGELGSMEGYFNWQNGWYYGDGWMAVATCVRSTIDGCDKWGVTLWFFSGTIWVPLSVTFEANEP